MLKLLIVDDEQLDREGLRDQISWEEYGITFVETAKSGFDALRRIEEIMPDIIITDVRMPGMNGMKLVEQIRKIIPSIKVIFVSGHDDFEFVKEALRLGADSYILKPVDTIELIETLNKVTADINNEQQQKNSLEAMQNIVDKSKHVMRDKIFLDLIYGTVNREEIDELKRYSEDICNAKFFSTLLIEFDDFDILLENLDSSEIEEKLGQAHRYIMDYKSIAFVTYPIKLDKKRYVILAAFLDIFNNDYRKFIVEENENIILHYIKTTINLSMTLAEGIYVETLEDVYKSYDICCNLLLQKAYHGNGTVLRNSLSLEDNIHSNKIFNKIDQELVKCILNQDENRMNHLIDYLFDSIETMKILDSKYLQYMCINIISRLEIALYEMNEEFESIFGPEVYLLDKLMRFETITDIRQWMKNTFIMIIDYQNKKTVKRNRKIVEMVKQYIEENYHKEISLKEISYRLYYSPNHLGLIIKEELGKGFSEYLVEYRMKKACEFLKDPCMKMYEVSEKVSYKNVTAFVKKFKEQYGVTPKEYREGC